MLGGRCFFICGASDKDRYETTRLETIIVEHGGGLLAGLPVAESGPLSLASLLLCPPGPPTHDIGPGEPTIFVVGDPAQCYRTREEVRAAMSGDEPRSPPGQKRSASALGAVFYAGGAITRVADKLVFVRKEFILGSAARGSLLPLSAFVVFAPSNITSGPTSPIGSPQRSATTIPTSHAAARPFASDPAVPSGGGDVPCDEVAVVVRECEALESLVAFEMHAIAAELEARVEDLFIADGDGASDGTCSTGASVSLASTTTIAIDALERRLDIVIEHGTAVLETRRRLTSRQTTSDELSKK